MNPNRDETLLSLTLKRSANGDIAIWDLAKIDQQLAELGLGFAP